MNQNRQSKALDLVEGMNVEQKTPLSFVVNGQSKTTYRVYTHGIEMLNADGREHWACECMDYKTRCRKAKIDCKHIMAAKVFRTLQKM